MKYLTKKFWTESSVVSHGLIALGIILLFGVPLSFTAVSLWGMWISGLFSVGMYFGREGAHAENKIGSTDKLFFLKPWAWHDKSQADFLGPLIVVLAWLLIWTFVIL